ncbi:MAG: hypothetical protein GY855_08410 [candidate division Zixibacteria bacterium]|nr:hypothetical protein [candidate division Zixibacteria bacterium]
MLSSRAGKTKVASDLIRSKPKLEDKSNYGLCTTCNYASECLNALNSTEPVLFCEEFDDYVEPAVKEKPKVNASPAPVTAEPCDLKGLCVNCEERHVCKFPKPEEGVWHCEEYR